MLRFRMHLCTMLVTIVMLNVSAGALSAQTDPVADFYRGRQIHLLRRTPRAGCSIRQPAFSPGILASSFRASPTSGSIT